MRRQGVVSLSVFLFPPWTSGGSAWPKTLRWLAVCAKWISRVVAETFCAGAVSQRHPTDSRGDERPELGGAVSIRWREFMRLYRRFGYAEHYKVGAELQPTGIFHELEGLLRNCSLFESKIFVKFWESEFFEGSQVRSEIFCDAPWSKNDFSARIYNNN